MAPIFAGEVGSTPQIIDDERLVQLRKSFSDIKLLVPLGQTYTSVDNAHPPVDIDQLVALVEPWQTWVFEEQVDLQEWMQPLNKIDASLSYYIKTFPAILLISPVSRAKSRGAVSSENQPLSKPAETLEEVNSVPRHVLKNIGILLHFLSGLLMNSSNKVIFNSVEELVDLLGAADDSVASDALRVLCSLSTPPALHKQQAPEVQQHSTALHTSKSSSHTRLMALARGWGTRGSGLGLHTCATTDDSEFGQGTLPKEAGELHFTFFKSNSSGEEETAGSAMQDSDSAYMVQLSLLKKDIVDDSRMMTESSRNSDESDESSSASKQKRRRVAPVTLGEQSIRSTAELFFECIKRARGRNKIPEDQLFPLLADIRLTRSFHCRATRILAVKRRLRALTAILHSHPSQEIMSGYFQAQPELCVELIDLLRPTVSSASVSSSATKVLGTGSSGVKQDAISALANSPAIPYEIRELSLQALTALVARRDGTTGALTGVARHTNVLSELGVGKGQYLGLLPTLIRYSLASLGALLNSKKRREPVHALDGQSAEDAIAFDIGLSFVEATMPPPLPRGVELLKGLEFVDSVLTLTSAVVSTPSGTSALTECGLIPALLTTVAVDYQDLVGNSMTGYAPHEEVVRIKALLRFVTAQAVQIIEGAIVTHNNALSAFHDLLGVEILTRRLSNEILDKQSTRRLLNSVAYSPDDAMDCDPNVAGNAVLDLEMAQTPSTRLRCSQRVLFFSIVTCLTVVFHQESTSSSVTVPSGSTELRKPELTKALAVILDKVEIYGGHLTSLVATLLSDVMNSDPHIVKYVHESGLAKSFLRFFPNDQTSEPLLPPVPELIMAVPNVLSALALTEDGAKAVKEANPFPALLKLFYNPKYAMPRSRCLLNEMTAIVGTGLDEMMRHISDLKPLICSAIVDAMNQVAVLGEELGKKELQSDLHAPEKGLRANDLENQRSCLMQYALNFGQLLEQILHNEDHCDPFVAVGGLEALLRLHPCLMPTGWEFLSHTSCLSCPSVSTLSHSTTEDSMTLAFKCIALRYDPFKLLQTQINFVNTQLSKLEDLQSQLREVSAPRKGNYGLAAKYILEGLPRQPLYSLIDPSMPSTRNVLADYLRQVVSVQWATGLLSAVIKAACQRSQETGTGWSRQEREWKKELSSTAFEELIVRLSTFHRSAIFEVCRIRTQDGFEEREKESRNASNETKQLRYRLRIVCPEGAVVRDGIEIDSCASVGSMEMGEIVVAFDRCINSSGVLRYRTHRGWVSEQTRGHGREPIAEVLSVWETRDETDSRPSEINTKDRVEIGIPDLQTMGANVLARVQSSYSELFSSLSRVITQGVRSLPVRLISFQQGTVGAHIATIMRILTSEISKGFNDEEVLAEMRDPKVETSTKPECLALYLGCLLNHLRPCLFEEKRDRRTANVPLLIALSNVHDSTNAASATNAISIFDVMRFILNQGLIDFEERASQLVKGDSPVSISTARRRLSRTTAASLPAAIAILKCLISAPSITSSPVSSVLSRVKVNHLSLLLGEKDSCETQDDVNPDEQAFSPEIFFRKLLCNVSDTVRGIWIDQRFAFAPPHVTHPIAMLVTVIITNLEESTRKPSTSTARSERDNSGLWNAFRGLVANRGESASASNVQEDFEPSEVAITRLMEMGFSRDHAWDAIDSTRSNQLEVELEYALSHPPPSPGEIERRRNDRQERQREREQNSETGGPVERQEEPTADVGNGGDSGESGVASSETMDIDQSQGNDDAKKPSTDNTMTDAKLCLERWKAEATITSCDVLSRMKSIKVSPVEVPSISDTEVSGDGDLEALTVVLSSFLLDICQRYPRERARVATELFSRLETQITVEHIGDSTEYEIASVNEDSFSSLCHATVLFMRALPKTRNGALEKSLVGKIISCIEKLLKTTGASCPNWLAPALLFLDILAQPVVAFSNKKEEDALATPEDSSELKVVEQEHTKQSDELSSLANDLVLALRSDKIGTLDRTKNTDGQKNDSERLLGLAKKEPKEAIDEAKKDESSRDSGKADEMLFKAVPAYFPLLPSASIRKCADVCLSVLQSDHKSPGVVHGALLLLMRLLRSPNMSIYCLKAGTAENILALSRQSRFAGHSGLVTLILRRLLEDEKTLQAGMETEIRGTITKLHSKIQRSSVDDKEKASISRKAFVQAITPLLCREPASFLKAVAVTVRFEKGRTESVTDGKVTLLSASERMKNARVVSDVVNRRGSSSSASRGNQARRSTSGKPKKSSPRSKTPVRANKRGLTPKRSKKEKADVKERTEDDPKVPPAHTVISLLINCTIRLSELTSKGSIDSGNEFHFGYDSGFLWVADVLGILSDLVLAIPACATAIHKFRPSKGKRNCGGVGCQHALRGNPTPPRTFVSYILHTMILQDRWTSLLDKKWTSKSDDESKEAKRSAIRRTGIAQSSARLLVALVARPGEGRRRVLAELAFALSGGQLGLHSACLRSKEIAQNPSGREVHALQAWGELCIGLAAPRSNGNNYDGNTSLSFEVIRLMLDIGMAHALLIAMHEVPLSHPRATLAIGALIVPFEVLSRPSVGEGVKNLIEKDSKFLKGSSKSSKPCQSDSGADRNLDGPSRHDSFATDHMLEDAFAVDATESQNVGDSQMSEGFVQVADHQALHEDDHDDRYVDADADPDMDEAEDEEHEMEIDDDVDEEDASDDEMSSSEDSDGSSEEDESDEDGDDNIDEDGESIIEDDDSTDNQDFEEADDFNEEYREDLLIEDQGFDPEAEGSIDRAEQGVEDGWTRIESSGFEGAVLGGRRGIGQQLGGTMSTRTRGFIDAAEAMIGTLLRTGEIHGDALAEIEGSLGIRIMHQGANANSLGTGRSNTVREEIFGNSLVAGTTRGSSSDDPNRREVVGTLPQVHQRSQPDVGYSALGGGGRWGEISSMEFVFGGPSITAGSRNYDLVPRALDQEDEETLLSRFAQVDAPLFPGGPASLAHSRSQHAIHPLLCGVNLPPANALVSDLLPHSVRAPRNGQMATRRHADWTGNSFPTGSVLVSTSNGNIIRSNRGTNGVPLSMASQRGTAGQLGWTDDGLSFDATVEEFTLAFERALGESMTVSLSQVEGAARRNESEGGSPEDNSALEGGSSELADMEESADAPMDEVPAEQPNVGDSSNTNNSNNEGQIQETNEVGGVAAASLDDFLRSTPNELYPLGHIDTQMSEAHEDVAENRSTENAVDGDGENDAENQLTEGRVAEDSVTQSDAQDVGGAPIELANRTEDDFNADGLACPSGMDPEVFAVLPLEMQREVVDQARTTENLASQLDAGSSLDPEALAALPEEIRREVIEQEQRERRLREQAPADPANAEEMDNASFVASLSPELRQEILMTADDAFLQSLPPNIIAEAQVLRDRASVNRRVFEEPAPPANQGEATMSSSDANAQRSSQRDASRESDSAALNIQRRKQRAYGKLKVESDRDAVIYLPAELSPPVAKIDLVQLLRFLYLLNPVRPHKLLQKVYQNLCAERALRQVVLSSFIKLLHDENTGTIAALASIEKEYGTKDWRSAMDSQYDTALKQFPPSFLIGAAPDVPDSDGFNPNLSMLRRKQTTDTAVSIAVNLPMTARGSRQERRLPPVVATRIVDTLQNICKNSPRFCIDILVNGLSDSSQSEEANPTGFEKLLDLLEKPRYSKSSANLEQLLVLLESAVSPLSHLPKHGEEDAEITEKNMESAAAAGKEWIDAPRIVVSQERLQLLCSILRMETCRDSSFAKVNTIARRLCRIDANRGYVLAELASVARALGVDAIRDLKALSIRMTNAVEMKKDNMDQGPSVVGGSQSSDLQSSFVMNGSASSSVAVSSSRSELKLLRVLQTLQALCVDSHEEVSKKNDGTVYVTDELAHLLSAMELDTLWAELTACLKVVQVLEGVKMEDDTEKTSDDNDGDEENVDSGKKLQNSVAGLLTRFLPSIEAFFVANASATRAAEKMGKEEDEEGQKHDESAINSLVGGNALVDFVTANKVLLNALIRNNAGLLDKGLRALIQVPRCRHLLDFDVKRHWFKTQVRRLRQQANRRFGSLRLHIRRRHVFEDAYHQLRLRNADEMRGRLHITFRNEEGVDAGGLSREFFGILAKEIFNPNYALFTSTEDGSTFQPNPNSSINPDHLSYFRFVGRIVGKAVSDGYLLDAHFTRSLYKHMLGIKPTHDDMEAIDPDYYKNLKTILEYDLGDLGLELTFSIEDHSFGRNRMIDLIPDGRNVAVTEQTKEKYVSLVCQHRMTTAIASQIKAYLDGFYELVSRDLVTIFTPRELELLISGLPDIDVHDLKKNTDYVGWKATDRQIQWFWNVLFSLSRNQKASFLQFVTGSSKVPLAGFGELPGMRGVQKFSIHKAGGSKGALMSAHTCFNSLDLPVYNSEEELKEKLLYAIAEGGGTFLMA